MSELPVAPPAMLPAGLAEPAFDPNAMRVLKERYFAKKADGTSETPKEFLWRVASAIAKPERPYAEKLGKDADAVVDGVSHAFYDLMSRRDFMPNTPCLVNAGRPLSMLSACFVLPVPDSIEDIFYNLQAMALIQKSGGGCVSADSRVWTTFCGLEPIEVLFNRATIDGRAGVATGNGIAYDVRDLGIKTVSMDPIDGATALKSVSHVWKFDVPADDQVVVRTREGVEVQTSAWHPFMVLRGRTFEEVRADALAPGDVVLGPEKPDAYWPWETYRTVGTMQIDEHIGWLIGFTLGDGSFGYVPTLRQERLRWFSGDTDVLDRVREILADHGINVGMTKDSRGNTHCVTTLKQEFVANMLAACGFTKRGPKDARIRIPEHIAKSPLSVVRAFVAGLLDSDGTVATDGSPSYATVSAEMAHDVSALMGLLGYRPTLSSKAPRGRSKQTCYNVLLCALPHVNELATEVARYMASERRKGRLHSTSRVETALGLPFRAWRDELFEAGVTGKRGPRVTSPVADELSRWSSNAAGRVRRDDLRRIAGAVAHVLPSAGALLETLALRGQEIEGVARASRPMPYYDLTVDEWNTYASGRTGMAMIHNTGFSFSDLRHQGAEVVSTGKDASGPVSFMKVFNAATDSIKQGGVRRGANMGVLRVDHPDIHHFMSCKKELDAENRALWNRMSDTGRYSDAQLAHMKQELLQTQINNFNISVGVTDAFMAAVKADGDFDLRDPRTNETVRTVKAREIWDAIVEGAWQNGEPGVLFLDHPHVNPLPGLGPIAATNPCLTGDTLVAVADGRGHVRIDELAASGKDVPVFCLDESGRVTVRTMRRPRKTGKAKKVYRVRLDDGSVVRATENHKFRLRDLSFREVRDLKAGDSLKIMTKYRIPVVVEGDPIDKKASKLQLSSVDARLFRDFDEALAQDYEAQIVGRTLLVTKFCEGCDNEFTIPYASREIAFCSRACNAELVNADPFAKQREALRELQLDAYTALRASHGSQILKRDWQAACAARGISAEISAVSSPFRSYAELQEAASTFNHRVVSVEFDGLEDVFNGTVDEFHNFFVGGFIAADKRGREQITDVNVRNCGEQFLHGYDSCNLGSINVGNFYDERAKDVDWERLAQATALSLRFLDNVIDANIYPIDEIKNMVTNNRRVGLGIMGFAELLIRLEIAYGSSEAITFAEKLMGFIQARAEETSETLARERGDFPNKHLSIWADDPRPRRNAALLSIAPTGTISMIAGCAFGCEPYFGMAYTKHVMKDAEGRPQHLYYVVPLFEEIAKREGFFSQDLLGKIEENRGSLKGIAEVPKHWQDVFTTSADVTVDQHIDMLAAFQKNTDNSVSKTINAPNDDTRENVSRAILRAYEGGCKGFTYYRDGSRTEQVVTFSKDNDLAGGNRDVAAPAAAPIASTPAPAGTNAELDIAALLAKANALLEVR